MTESPARQSMRPHPFQILVRPSTAHSAQDIGPAGSAALIVGRNAKASARPGAKNQLVDLQAWHEGLRWPEFS